MSTHQIHIFVSHSWAYSSHYKTLSSWIFEKKWRIGQASLNLLDFSVPRNDPIHNAPTARQLREAIYRKIAFCHVVVIPTGMYATHSNWIRKEINGASAKAKPILAVNPWGQQRTASVVSTAAKKTVGWNKESVIRGIWNLYYP
ncbi:MAG: TIR domain-containing protein [Gammaproteobacteria bacterium]|nr:TIR domain-containing protein [Gammaproteobacteria bacterium]